jgi:formate hydrogenlyase transcriptional activator
MLIQEDYFKNIFNTVREGILILDENMRVLSANRSFLNIFKVDTANTVGSLLYDLGNGQWNIPELRMLLEDILPKNDTVDDYEIKHKFESIGRKTMLLNACKIREKKNDLPIILLAIEDITERKKVEKDLAVTEGKYKELVQNANSIILKMDMDGKVVFFNEFAKKFFGYTEEEILGCRVVGTIVPEAGYSGIDINSMIKDIATNPDKFINNENENIRRDGERIWVAWTNRAIRDELGNVTEILCIGNDITERKRLEDLLAESEERYRRLFETASDGIVLLEKREGHIINANPATEKMLGYSEEECIGKYLKDIGVLLDMSDFPAIMQTLNRSGIINFDDVQVKTKSGQYIETDIYLVDRARVAQCNIRDITERKKLEKQIFEAQKKEAEQLQAVNRYLLEEVKLLHTHENIVGNSDAIRSVLKQVEQVASTDSTVLIQGETGTGKELLADAIHNLSPRKGHLLVKVNCAALPPTLIESELFGREKGAFTGSDARQIGRFELADGGTLFLDEISEMPLELQTKLLRVLQNGEFERLGNPKTIKVSVRLITATNRDLNQYVRERRFREDLFYRLNIFPIFVPPLRERKEDILPLVWSFIQEFGTRMGKRIESIPPKDIETLQNYGWPGNVRELRNVIERSMIMSNDPVLRIEIPKSIVDKNGRPGTLEEIESQHIIDILNATSWRVSGKSGAAEILGLNPKTLESRMKKLGIQRKK